MATLAVKDLDTARRFYEELLGLEPEPAEEQEPVLVYKSGGTSILVYESQYAGTNQATAITWDAGDDVEGVVEDLKAKGISFEHYDLPGATLKGDVHVFGDIKNAWFKDPDGNIHSVVGR